MAKITCPVNSIYLSTYIWLKNSRVCLSIRMGYSSRKYLARVSIFKDQRLHKRDGVFGVEWNPGHSVN